MKKNLKKAVRFEVREKGEQRFIQLFDENGNELDGENAYWEGGFHCTHNRLTTLKGRPDDNQLTKILGNPKIIGGNVIIGGKVYSNIKYEYSNKDGCEHLNKYKNIISNRIKFWYCPDCKKDLGDI